MSTAKRGGQSRRRVRAAGVAALIGNEGPRELVQVGMRRDRRFGPSETMIVRGILEYLRIDGRMVAWRQNTGVARHQNKDGSQRFVRFSENGAADIQGVLRPSGRFVALEVKRPGLDAEPHQRAWGQVIESAGGVYRVVHHIDEARAVLDELAPRTR